MKRCSLASAVLVLAALFSVRARADQDIQGEVLVVLASHDAGAIDPAVAQEPALHEPPFDTFHSMRVLDRIPMTIGTHSPFTHPLANGRTLRLELLDHAPPRLAARVSISRPNAPDFLPGVTVETDPGVPFVVAGQSYEGGTLVLLVRLGTRPVPPAALRVNPSLRLLTPPPAPPSPPPPAPAQLPASPAAPPRPSNGANAARKNSPPAPAPHPPAAES